VMAITSLNSVNQLIFAMVKSCILFEVRTGFINTSDELLLEKVKIYNFMY
jgi:hypothetical protein